VKAQIVKANAVDIANMGGANCLGILMEKNPRCKVKILSSVPFKEKNTKILISKRMGP
jgi:hypothetical protein